eukprot:scaffold5.g820.t1
MLAWGAMNPVVYSPRQGSPSNLIASLIISMAAQGHDPLTDAGGLAPETGRREELTDWEELAEEFGGLGVGSGGGQAKAPATPPPQPSPGVPPAAAQTACEGAAGGAGGTGDAGDDQQEEEQEVDYVSPAQYWHSREAQAKVAKNEEIQVS